MTEMPLIEEAAGRGEPIGSRFRRDMAELPGLRLAESQAGVAFAPECGFATRN